MNRNIFISIVAIIVLCRACDSDNVYDEIKPNVYYEVKSGFQPYSDDTVKVIIDTLSFSYKGKTITAPYSCVNGSINILNDYAANIFESLKNKKDVAILVDKVNYITFFDNYDEMYSNIYKKSSWIVTRSTVNKEYIKNFELRVWRDSKGRKNGGPYLGWFSNGTQGEKSPEPLYVNQPFLNSHSMDNAISSCQMWVEKATNNSFVTVGLSDGQYPHATVTFYENANYSGRSLSLTEMSINYEYSEVDYFSSLGFNDLTSSIKVVYDNNL